MVDKNKLSQLAKTIVNYSIELKKGETVLLKGYGLESYPMIKELYREAIVAGGYPVVRFSTGELSRIFMEEASDEQLTHVTNLDKKIAESYDAMVQIVADENRYEMMEVDPKKNQLRGKAFKKVSDIMRSKKWCLMYYPTAASAALAKYNTEAWEDFVLDSCLLNWKKVFEVEMRFIDLLKKVSEVKVMGEETDLVLSIKGQKWKPCCGKRNLPDGEVFTAPVRTAVNGVIRYNTPSHYAGHDFNWVKLWIKDGKVVDEDSDNKTALTEILDTDKGARYFGEFAFGLNKYVKKATRMILFDEKMEKSLHMALGQCYKECPNGNDSMIHWDLIFRFKEAKAKIWFDGDLVYSGGKWKDKKFEFLNKAF